MNWENIYSEKRTGTETKTSDDRSEYQRDFDRLIFCPGFRRLQNKTQIFPLPGAAFVHNRLTHSLEVASVGRSLGKIVGSTIARDFKMNEASKNFYKNELQNVVAAACLAHDIGNPPFGHSGEKAISKFFVENEDVEFIKTKRIKKKLIDCFTDKEWKDLANFEGNANGFRFLTHDFQNKVPGGLRLTYTTLAATIKYPCESTGVFLGKKHLKKYNFFQSEKKTFLEICSTLNMDQESTSPVRFKRHPFAYLTEAADDICYNIVDMEDAVRLGIISAADVESLFYSLIKCVNLKILPLYDMVKLEIMKNSIIDANDKISYLRAKCINVLIMICAAKFEEHQTEIINGTYNDDLSSYFMSRCKEMGDIKRRSQNEIYNHDTVVKVELTGYKVLYDLLEIFIPSIIKDEIEAKDEKILSLIPKQFLVDSTYSDYYKVMGVLDFVSGMTDTFATQLYRDLHGIDIVKHS